MSARVIRWTVLVCAVMGLGAWEPVMAQTQVPVRSLVPSKGKGESRLEVPRSHLPPKGMCRVWLDNVPPAQQPAPTDCASAIRNRPSNGRVIFSEDKAGKGAGEAAGKEEGDPKKRRPRRPSV